MNTLLRVVKLDKTDKAYSNGGRWVLIAPAWGKGCLPTIAGVKVPTLESAVKAAERGTTLYKDINFVADTSSSIPATPQTIESCRDDVAAFKAARQAGKQIDFSEYLD